MAAEKKPKPMNEKPAPKNPKSMGNLAEEEKNDPSSFTEQNKNKDKQLIFVVTGDQHTKFKKDAADRGLSMKEYFFRLWEGKK